MIDKTIIMHISDLHFGIEQNKPMVRDYRKKVLTTFKRDFINMITQDPGLAPDILVVSGDIAYDGSAKNYKEAESFFNWITNEDIKGNKISRENVIICFGNHDVHALGIKFEPGPATGLWIDYTARRTLSRPEPNCDFKQYYEFELDIDKRYHRFKNAEDFCKKMGFVALKSNSRRYKYAYGYRSVKGIDFISLNTEWDFWGDKDKNAKGQLRIGSNLYLEATSNFKGKDLFDLDTPPRFVIYHRPLECLHIQEQRSPESHIADRIVGNMIFHENDVSLNGHIHLSSLRTTGTHTQITAGSVHTNDKWEFTCNLIFVPKVLIEGLNKCSVLLYKYNSEFSLWHLDPFSESNNFNIVRSNKYKQIVDYIIKFREWIKKRDGLVREQLKNELVLLSDETSISILITLLSEAGLHEIKKELEGTKLTTFTLQGKFQGKDDNSGPAGGSSGGFTKSDEKVKELILSQQSTSGEGYIPPTLIVTKERIGGIE